MIKGVKIINLRSIKNGSNFLRDGIKNSELKDKKFGEIYTSTISYKEIRAWKLQKKLTLDLLVPIGKVKICLYDGRLKNNKIGKKHTIILSQNPYFRLRVPPGVWYGFCGLSKNINLIIAITNSIFNENEVKRLEISDLKF